MKNKILWLVVSCLMALSLLMASCAPAAIEEEEEVTPPEEAVVTEEEVAPPPEGPKYGGELRGTGAAAGATFDPGYGGKGGPGLNCEKLLTGDWSRGQAGTGELTWVQSPFMPQNMVGCLAESWEVPDDETTIFHIRQGVHFHDKPPVNGREMTAEDVAFSINRLLDMPLGTLAQLFPAGDITSVTAPDKWTVVVKCRPETIKRILAGIGDYVPIFPVEGGGEYPGDFREWQDVCGTGPFIMIDHVDYGSSTFVRNPNYWRKDPLRPENPLPYVDGIVNVYIGDASTTRAAFRTGKIDTLGRLDWEVAPILWETVPEAKWRSNIATGALLIAMRLDTPPFGDIRVRRALAMGINRQELKDLFFGGDAELCTWPIMPIPEFKDMQTPLDELPESTQELYEYKPDKARQLLAEAGYPNGFKTTILCSEGTAQVDMLSIIKEYWAKIGVDLELQVRTKDALVGLITEKKHEAMVYKDCFKLTNPYEIAETRSWSKWNWSMINDPYVDELYNQIQDTLYEPECHQLLKEYTAYVLDKCWYIQTPAPRKFAFWQPWLMDYHGEQKIPWQSYVWVDQELKKKITGR